MIKRKRIVSLSMDDEKFVVTQTKDGFVFTISGSGKHCTFLYQRGCLTAHVTNESTGEHVNSFAMDFERVSKKAEDPFFQHEVQERLLSILKRVRSRRQLKAEGVIFLLRTPQGTFLPPFDNKLAQEIVESNIIPIAEAWKAEPGASFFAYGNEGIVGIVIVSGDHKRKMVRFARRADIVRFSQWLINEVSGPTDQLMPSMRPGNALLLSL